MKEFKQVINNLGQKWKIPSDAIIKASQKNYQYITRKINSDSGCKENAPHLSRSIRIEKTQTQSKMFIYNELYK